MYNNLCALMKYWEWLSTEHITVLRSVWVLPDAAMVWHIGNPTVQAKCHDIDDV